jgi:dTDP-4-amino-4,6-dideoxy-D-glucose transaminase
MSPEDASPEIYVTQPYLPPLEEVLPYLERIWSNRRLTNGGPFHQEFEQALCEYLGVEHISLFANGTLALVTALQVLRITGEVITTPYSFVATSHALNWNGVKPVFVDVNPQTLNLDPGKVEAAITPQTTAILPVHVYGRPCDTGLIQSIADTYGLKVIYDAAHAFGVEDQDGSIARHGDLSILSFHATKVFTTFEGGAIVSPDAKTKKRVDYLKNFGFADEVTVIAPGINGKMNEFQAAIGLVQLKHFDAVLKRRSELDRRYRQALADVAGIRCLPPSRARRHNYSYFPVLVEDGYPLSRDELYGKLRKSRIHGRRYFYPLISEFPMYKSLPSASPAALPSAHHASARVICLPIYPALNDTEVDRIVGIIKDPS